MVDTFRPADVTAVFAGIPWEGYAEGTMITAAKNNDGFNLSVGSTGSGARAQSSDESGTVVVRFQQTATVNALLSAQHELDKASGDGVGPFLCKDLSGADVIAAESMWIRKVADVEYGNEIVAREWTLESDNLVITPGGNP